MYGFNLQDLFILGLLLLTTAFAVLYLLELHRTEQLQGYIKRLNRDLIKLNQDLQSVNYRDRR